MCVCIGYRQVSESWPRPVNLLKENVGQLLFMQRNRQRKEGKEKGTICGINGELSIAAAHDRWMKLKEVHQLSTHEAVALLLLDN